MIDLTQIDPAYRIEIKYADDDIVEYDCLEIMDKLREEIRDRTIELRDRIKNNDIKIIALYGEPIPSFPDTEENKTANANVYVENNDRAEAIVQQEATSMELEAMKAILEKDLPMSAIVKILHGVKDKVQELGSEKKA